MAKADLKTKETSEDPRNFLNTLADRQQREDSFKLVEIMKWATGDEPKMWGTAIIGFGNRTLKYDSGRELDWMTIGFSPRKANIALYLSSSCPRYEQFIDRLGKYKTGKSCLYIKRLSDVDLDVLEELIACSVDHIRGRSKGPGLLG